MGAAWGINTFPGRAGIKRASINMFGSLVYVVPSSKNRPFSQGSDDVCSLPASPAYKSAPSSYWKSRDTVCVWRREHQWSPWQHVQSDAGKSNTKKERQRLAVKCSGVCTWKRCVGGRGGGELSNPAVRLALALQHAHIHTLQAC